MRKPETRLTGPCLPLPSWVAHQTQPSPVSSGAWREGVGEGAQHSTVADPLRMLTGRGRSWGGAPSNDSLPQSPMDTPAGANPPVSQGGGLASDCARASSVLPPEGPEPSLAALAPRHSTFTPTSAPPPYPPQGILWLPTALVWHSSARSQLPGVALQLTALGLPLEKWNRLTPPCLPPPASHSQRGE